MPSRRATAKPPLRTSTTPHRSGATAAAAKPAASAGPAYDVAKGRRAVKCDPSSARPDRAPSTTDSSVLPWLPVKLSTQRSQRRGGTRTTGTATSEVVERVELVDRDDPDARQR